MNKKSLFAAIIVAFVGFVGYAVATDHTITGPITFGDGFAIIGSRVSVSPIGYPAGWIAGNNPNNAVVVTVNKASTITEITGRVEIPVGSSATVSVYKAANGVACSAGTILHSGTFDANGAASSLQTLALTVTSLAAHDSICFQTTGGADWTGGAGIGTITVSYVSSS